MPQSKMSENRGATLAGAVGTLADVLDAVSGDINCGKWSITDERDPASKTTTPSGAQCRVNPSKPGTRDPGVIEPSR